jgi:thiamine phosphate synthase YjbQ (UPF0047 family)
LWALGDGGDHDRTAAGTWQQIALVEFDTRPRTRRYIVQIVGD